MIESSETLCPAKLYLTPSESRHYLIERAAQVAEFVVTMHIEIGIEEARPDSLRGVRHLHYRLRKSAREDEAGDNREKQRADSRQNEVPP